MQSSMTEQGGGAPSVLPTNVPVDGATKSPQFLLLATSFFCIATGGIGLFSVVRLCSSPLVKVFVSVLTSFGHHFCRQNQ